MNDSQRWLMKAAVSDAQSRHCWQRVEKLGGLIELGALGKNRTCDARFRKPTLYPLSYEGWSIGMLPTVGASGADNRFESFGFVSIDASDHHNRCSYGPG